MSSSYFRSLSKGDQERYEEKLFNGLFPDPFDELVRLSCFKNNVGHLPNIEYPEIYNYLINSPGIFTKENLAAYKSLEAYNFFYSGKVREVVSFSSKAEGYVQVYGKVMPSQKTTSPPHETWIAARTSGEIIYGHCLCMAGLGEVCSHVAALLFTISATVKELQDCQPTCTSQPMKWNAPATAVPADMVENISFNQPKVDKLDIRRDAKGASVVPAMKGSPTKLLTLLMACVPDAVVFTCVNKRKLDDEVTETASEDETTVKPYNYKLPSKMTDVFKETNLQLESDAIPVLAQATLDSLYVEDEDVSTLERLTLTQASSELWRLHRKGRITASVMHEVLTRRDTTSPVLLLQKLMGYKESKVNNVKAIVWGKKHEKNACQEFIRKESKRHDNFTFKAAGFVLSKSSPYLGASPDGYVCCNCCGESVVEIKCPLSMELIDIANDELPSSFYLDENKLLKKNHKYYTQVQGQMAITGRKNCFFVVWNTKGVVSQMIAFDEDFWNRSFPILRFFFQFHLLPELLTRRLEEDKEDQWCFCRKPSSGRMVACDSNKCPHIWFHFSCVGLTRKPRGKWFCKDCK